MGDIVFDGPGPFMLPSALLVGAIQSQDRVEISLRVQATPARQETILVTVSVNQATELVSLIRTAISNVMGQNSPGDA